MEKQTRLGVLGCSSIADRAVLPVIVKSPDFKLIAVGSRNPDKGKLYADKYACESCSYSELIGRSDIDAIYISLPVGLHFEWGLAAVHAGKHVLIEKTFTETREQANTIIHAARENSVIAMEALVYVYHPLYQKVCSLIEQGAIGNVRSIAAYFGFPFRPVDDIRYQRSLGGGATLDALVYPLSLCLNLFSEKYLNISASLIHDDNYDVDVRGFLQIDWPTCSAQIGYGFGFTYRNAYSIWGENAVLTVDRAFTRPPDLQGEIILDSQTGRRIVDVAPANHFEYMLSAFGRKICGEDKTGSNEGSNILRRMEVISYVMASSHRSTSGALSEL